MIWAVTKSEQLFICRPGNDHNVFATLRSHGIFPAALEREYTFYEIRTEAKNVAIQNDCGGGIETKMLLKIAKGKT